jgi:cytochrome bd-type quinol oxidase subunit 1
MLEGFDALLLARAQFAFTVSFHFIFPAFSIGLASYLMVLEALWLRTDHGVYANLHRYWLKIFALAFAMGVVSGLVMSYQFGTNWSVFSDRAGPVIGPLMAYEVLTAFFSGSGLSRRDALRHQQGGTASAFRSHLYGCAGHDYLSILDPVGQQARNTMCRGGAVIAGWITTEVGRQPWTIYGVLPTAHSVAPLDAPAVAASLIAFIVIYFCVFGAGVWYILRLMAKAMLASP